MRFVKATIGAIVIIAAAAGGMTLSDRLLTEPELARGPSDAPGEAVPVETVAVQTARFVDSVRAVAPRARAAPSI
ncbi:hypothetical protein [Paracoccus sp. PAMC 22219]|uniref:hypothetical protein n=1 Tax=Paracoccus sp. PAMC 22219 TaxID=1569209 RepID=UPI0006985D47|nr:hypothetical protein [Paracoccus sp. PAMC 22219]